jgi:hypothetical protein
MRTTPAAFPTSTATVSAIRPDARSRSTRRWLVHLGLIAATVVSLVFEQVIAIRVAVGLCFVVLVAAHLAQRKHASAGLLTWSFGGPTVWW